MKAFQLAAVAALLATFPLLSPQEAAAETGGLDIQTFRPAVSPDAVFGVESSEVHSHLQLYGSLFFDYANQPLLRRSNEESTVPVIDHRMTSHLRAGIGLFDVVQVDLTVPVLLANDGSFGGQEIRGSALGRPSLSLKGNLLSAFDGAFGLGAALNFGIGGNQDALAGETGGWLDFQFLGNTYFENPLGELVLVGNVGVRNRQNRTFAGLELGPSASYGVGARQEIIAGTFFAGLELLGSVILTEPARTTSPLEIILGTSLLAADGLEVKAGLGTGLVSGIGSPRFRGFLGLIYSPSLGAEAPDLSASEDLEDEDWSEDSLAEEQEEYESEEDSAGQVEEEAQADEEEIYAGDDEQQEE